MRTIFILIDEAPTFADAENMAPWAAEIVECDGGWMGFESVADAETWNNQE